MITSRSLWAVAGGHSWVGLVGILGRIHPVEQLQSFGVIPTTPRLLVLEILSGTLQGSLLGS